MHMAGRLALLLLPCLPASATTTSLQNGDREGEAQPAIDKNFEVPPAPILTPEQELATFQLPPGYRIELVAADPQIHDPVDIAFDEFGRLWVVEMRSLMPNADGTGEQEPIGSIAVLTDTDSDGFFETRSVFAEDLVLPRGVAFGFGGVIAVLPPKLVLLHDTDGDGKADKSETIDEGKAFAAGLENVEHAPNAPRMGLDNWLYLANHNRRYRKIDGRWVHSPVPRRGQWGMGQDDWGRQVFNYNSTPLHGDLVPPHYVLRNNALGRAKGTNERLVADRKIFPSRMNVGVNRAYRDNYLTEEGRIKGYDAACGPVVYRGTALAPEDYGSTFVCEPAGNLIRQNRMTEQNGRVTGEAVRAKYSFLTSTDERFRPVNMVNGPDGALYICDLYRGILQHRVFLTSFLRRQIEERGLDKGIGLGRVWRVVHEKGTLDPSPMLGTQAAPDWVAALEAENGWRRSTAQRLIVEAGPKAAERMWDEPDPPIDPIISVDEPARTPGEYFQASYENTSQALIVGLWDPSDGRQAAHALWVLQGLGYFHISPIQWAYSESLGPQYVSQLIRLTENQTFPAHLQEWKKAIIALPTGAGSSGPMHWQFAHSLGPRIAAEERTPSEAQDPIDPWDLAVELLTGRDDDVMVRQGLLSGLERREFDLAQRLGPGFPKTLHSIGRLVAKRGDLAEFDRLFGMANEMVLEGFTTTLEEKAPGPFTQPKPLSLVALGINESKAVQALALRIEALLTFENTVTEADAERNRILAAALDRGKDVYSVTCIACHQPDGRGLQGLAPPLGDPKWLGKSDQELIRIVTRGLSGKIEVEGKTWNIVMPPWAHLSDRQVADVLTYTLQTFGKGDAKTRVIEPKTVKQER